MTPLQLDMLLHYYTRGFEYSKIISNETRSAQAQSMVQSGLLSFFDNEYSITPIGTAHIESILNLSLPVICFKLHSGEVVDYSGGKS